MLNILLMAYKSPSEVLAYFDKLSSMKNNIEKNKLSNRKDVQILRKKIAVLNQELIYSKQEMEQAKETYENIIKIHNKKEKQHREMVEYLTIITQKHEEDQNTKIMKLITLMQAGQSPGTCKKPELQEGDTLAQPVDNHGD